MNSYSAVGLLILALANLGVLLALFLRARQAPDARVEAFSADLRRLEQTFPDQFRSQREESARTVGELRQELSSSLNSGFERLLRQSGDARLSAENKLELFRTSLEASLRIFNESSDKRLKEVRQELNDSAAKARNEVRDLLQLVQKNVTDALREIRQTVDAKFSEIESRNEQKLEEMRRTVDEKLEATLERRLGESFKLVSERLEQVHRGLGEMQAMASSVGDLKRVLTNVKARGTWGEIQLGTLLEQILTPDQYGQNVATVRNSSERVEFAIRMPGGNGEGPVWLPIDAKFPQEDYQRLLDAAERADAEGVAEAGKALENRIRTQARIIRDKYIAVPDTTDFGILFLPSEGLYAEVLRRPGLADDLHRELRIVLAGPTTLCALLNSLQMGFRTLALQKRASEVWEVLGAVKTEFGKFGEVLSKVKKKLEEASTQIEQTETRTRAIARSLRDVEALPLDKTPALLPQATLEEVSDEALSLRENLPASQAEQNSLGI